jgi:N-acetylglucosamine-6-sulfatase
MRKTFVGFALVVATLLAFFSSSSRVEEGRAQEMSPPDGPNFVFVLADDLAERDMARLPGISAVMGERGATFQNAYVTQSLCCPSRASILTGRYPHNHGILSNTPPLGGGDRFHGLELDRSTFATWLDGAGYRTAYIGKYFNGYDEDYVPPGWDEWFAVHGSPLEDNYNDNGTVVRDPRHSTDIFAQKTVDFVRRASAGRDPFLAFVATKAPHHPPEVAARHKDAFADVPLPRPPSFNEADVDDKPRWARSRDRLSDQRISDMTRYHRERLASMLSVEDLLAETVAALRETGELDETYIIFASDNGYHMGQHRLIGGKLTAYEEDAEIPLMVRGPGIAPGATRPHLVLNNDLAPTIADLAGADVPGTVDGRSIAPLLTDAPPPVSAWRSAFLIEGWTLESSIAAVPEIPDYKTVHTREYALTSYATGEKELYYLPGDPHQLRSKPQAGNKPIYQKLLSRLERLRSCAGETCRTAEGG